MEEKAKEVANLLKVLANENRLLILCNLIEGPLTVGELHEKIAAITQSALSQHLALLKAHGIVADEKKGQHVTYTIKDHRVDEVIAVLQKHYC